VFYRQYGTVSRVSRVIDMAPSLHALFVVAGLLTLLLSRATSFISFHFISFHFISA